MKWSILGLVVLGMIAAVCAAVLVAMLQQKDRTPVEEKPITVYLATQDLPANQFVQKDHIEAAQIMPSKAPEKYSTSDQRILKQALSRPMNKGDVFTEYSFYSKGSGPELIATIPSGMRLFNVYLTDYSSVRYIIFPGCVVDVLVSFRLDNQSRGEALSATMLRGIRVVGVDEESVVSSGEKAETKPETRRDRRSNVTLLVTPSQAESLQLAQQYGSISLTLRNPNDEQPLENEGTILRDGKLAAAGYSGNAAAIRERLQALRATTNTAGPGGAGAEAAVKPASAPAPVASQPTVPAAAKVIHPPLWDVTLIRGKGSETVSFPITINAD